MPRARKLPARLSRSRQRLVEENVGLAVCIANRLCGSIAPDERDDVFGAARMALVRAARYYRPSRQVRFGSYAWTAIYREVSRAIGRLQVHRSREAGLPVRSDKPDPAEEACVVLHRKEWADCALRVADRLRASLRPDEWDLLAAIYGIGREAVPAAEYARQLGISAQAVSSRVRRVVEKSRILVIDLTRGHR